MGSPHWNTAVDKGKEEEYHREREGAKKPRRIEMMGWV